MSEFKDEGLKYNEKIEAYIDWLKKEPSDEVLAATLTSVRKSMKAGGQMIVALDAPTGDEMKIKLITLEDGKNWMPVFTSFDEEMKGHESVMSTFMADIRQIFQMVLQEPTVEGVVVNPWNLTLRLNKNLIRIILG